MHQNQPQRRSPRQECRSNLEQILRTERRCRFDQQVDRPSEHHFSMRDRARWRRYNVPVRRLIFCDAADDLVVDRHRSTFNVILFAGEAKFRFGPMSRMAFGSTRCLAPIVPRSDHQLRLTDASASGISKRPALPSWNDLSSGFGADARPQAARSLDPTYRARLRRATARDAIFPELCRTFSRKSFTQPKIGTIIARCHQRTR